MLDYIIIGGGISGLYFAMNCTGKSLVLEKNNRLGGRAYTTVFGKYDVRIPLGAGIGVAYTDDLLINLMNKIGLEYRSFYVDVTSERCQNLLLKLYNNISFIKDNMTFEDYMNIVLTKEEINIFRHDNGYTDFYSADAKTTMLEYGLIENCSKYMGLGIDWSKLIEKMSKYCNYKLSCEVISIKGSHPNIEVKTNRGSYMTKNVVIASTISTVKKLLDNKIYDRVKSHPFMRLYATFSGENEVIMKRLFPTTKVVGDKYHIIIPMGKNVWMIAYTDGDDALSLRDEFMSEESTREERNAHRIKIAENYLEKVCDKRIKIDELKVAFWREGVHYYTPGGDIDFKKLRNPTPGIFVVGEAVSYSQGWCNGALMTVDEVLSF